MARGWLVNPVGCANRSGHAKGGRPASVGPMSMLGCQVRLADFGDEGTMSAAGRSLPEMSLAFALMAAINGSTGSSAKLSHGLEHPHQASPTSIRRPSTILVPQRCRRKPPGKLSHKPQPPDSGCGRVTRAPCRRKSDKFNERVGWRETALHEVGQNGPAARLWRDNSAIPLCDSLAT